MARPRKKIDVEQLEKLAEKQWTTEEIAAFFRVHRRTIERRFAAKIEAAKLRGKAKLRDLQWKRAIEGSDTILKHMSEHYLGQTAKQKLEHEGRITLEELVAGSVKPEGD